MSPKYNIKELNHETFQVDEPFVALLPTYLEGGNGVDNGDIEILTNPLGDFIAAHDNHKRCFGIIGSGNRNFNNQYCLTANNTVNVLASLCWETLSFVAHSPISNVWHLLF